MNPTLKPQDEYHFHSAFESANLDCAIKIAPNQFDLFLRVDSNTKGHTGWYYFSIKNGTKKNTITLHLCNLKKPSPLYEQGMTPFVYSKKTNQIDQKQWAQTCTNVRFQPAPLRYDVVYQKTDLQDMYRLSFDYTFQHQDDEVFFAYCIPYSYSQLQHDLRCYAISPYFKQHSLGLSLTGLEIPLIHITQPSDQTNKKYIIITARVHPCESNSSYLARGIIQWLLASTKEAEELRQRAHFLIIPMINPDGVVLGNTRTSAAGMDLNRQFADVNQGLFPQVYLLKNFVGKMQRRGKVALYIDLHGHSKRKNTFVYGPNYPMAHSQYYRCRLLPKIIEKVNPSFRYYSCSFVISEDKMGTSRAVMLQQLKIPYVYTVQSSLGLYYSPIHMKTLPFNAFVWEQMGTSIGKAIHTFNYVMMEFQNSLNQRKVQRNKKKDKTTITCKIIKTYLQDQIQPKNKDSPASIYMQLLRQIKQATQNPKNFEQQADSDDYDPAQNFSPARLTELKTTVFITHNHSPSKQILKQFPQDIYFDIALPTLLLPDSNPNNPSNPENLCEKEDFYLRKTPTRLTKKEQNSPLKITKTIPSRPESKMFSDRIRTRKPVNQIQSRQTLPVQSKRQPPLNLYTSKPRYSIIAKNIYPVQDKFEVVSLPKSLQAMRRDMKKGRLLINNLEQSRLKFMSTGIRQQPQQIKIKKKPSFILDPARTRPGVRYSTTQISGNGMVNLNEQVRIKPSQPYLHGLDNYAFLCDLDVDKLAMTITNYKRQR